MQTVNQDGQEQSFLPMSYFGCGSSCFGRRFFGYLYILAPMMEFFANAQTGNIVLLAANLAETNWSRAKYLIDLAFFRRSFCDKFIETPFFGNRRIRFEQVVLLIEAALLLGIGFFCHCRFPTRSSM